MQPSSVASALRQAQYFLQHMLGLNEVRRLPLHGLHQRGLRRRSRAGRRSRVLSKKYSFFFLSSTPFEFNEFEYEQGKVDTERGDKPPTALVFHDDGTFTANEGQRKFWGRDKSHRVRQQGAGRGIPGRSPFATPLVSSRIPVSFGSTARITKASIQARCWRSSWEIKLSTLSCYRTVPRGLAFSSSTTGGVTLCMRMTPWLRVGLTSAQPESMCRSI